MFRRAFVTRVLPLAVTLVVAAFLPAAAHARVVRSELGPNDHPTGLVIVSPFRIERDVEPGRRKTIEVTLTNDSDEAVDITVSPTDLAASTDPRNFVEKVEHGEFGAGDWIVPEVTDDRLKAWEQIKFNLTIDPPASAAVGTSLGGLSVDAARAEGKPGTADQLTGTLRAEALIQIFLTVPGPVEHKLRITDVDIRDSLVVGSQRFVVWDVAFRNDGTVNEHVSGSFDIRSIFGNSAHREPISESLVLRGSTRKQRLIWNTVPWVGAFHPEIRVRGDNAQTLRATGGRVVIFPWWLPIAIGLVIIVPAIWLWWRRRREWRLYMDDGVETWDDEPDPLHGGDHA